MPDADQRPSAIPMRLVTWNCNLSLGKKLDALLSLEPDIAVVQECEQSLQLPDGYHFVWMGNNPRKGLGVITKELGLEISPLAKDNWGYFLPVSIDVDRLRLLATWAFNHRAGARIGPSYTGNPRSVIATLRDWLEDDRSIVAGDFNNSVVWDHIGRAARFRDINDDLEQLGLFSAYHRATGEDFGQESKATFFHTKNPEKPFHIDYCFLDESINCKQIDVAEFPAWRGLSDHVPVIADLELAR